MAAYTTSTAVGSLLSATFDGTSDPTQTEVNDIISRVTEYVTQFTGRQWSLATATEYLDVRSQYRRSLSKIDVWGASLVGYGPFHAEYGGAETAFFLKNRPIVSINTLQENIAGTQSQSWATRASGYGGDFLIYRDEGYIEFIRNYPYPGYKNLRILYTYGQGTIPVDIKYATELLSAVQVIDMIKRASDQQGLNSVSIGQTSYSFGDLENQRKRYREKGTEILSNRGFDMTLVWR